VAHTGTVYASLPITKQAARKGVTYAAGLASTAAVDRDAQIVDERFIKAAIAAWHGVDGRGGPVRVGHDPRRPAGKSVAVDGQHITVAVYEKAARRLLAAGVLRAFSVGLASPTIVPDVLAKGGRIVDGELIEVSLVDAPANPQCGITLVKRAPGGGPVFVGKSWLVKGKKKHPLIMCTKCGHELDAGEKFCTACGKRNPHHNLLADKKIPANKAAKMSKKKRRKLERAMSPAGLEAHTAKAVEVARADVLAKVAGFPGASVAEARQVMVDQHQADVRARVL
jgi:hypothetical protein